MARKKIAELTEQQRIVQEAMRDRGVYEQMARKESAVWGNALAKQVTGDKRAKVKHREAIANKELGYHRGGISFAAWARERGMTFEHALSIGCGSGRAERRALQAGLAKRMHGVDISEEAIAAAKLAAERENLPLTYEVADLNFADLGENEYDLVLAQTALHHCLYLENVADAIARALKPGGLLWLHDYVGESMFQYDGYKMELANRMLSILPEKYRLNTLTGRVIDSIKRPKLPLNSPFESIRSQEIPQIFYDRFEVVEKHEFVGVSRLVCPNGTKSAYAESEEGRTIFELIMLIDEITIAHGLIRPTGLQCILKAKK